MYQRVIHFTVISETEHTEALLRKVPSFERFTHCFQTVAPHNETGFGACDVLIIAHALARSSLKQLARQKRPGQILVYCVHPGNLANLQSEDLQFFDDLWMLPLQQETAGFFLTKLLKQIKLEKDLDLYRKYLEGVIESLPDMVWFKDLEGTHLMVNDAFCQAVGKSKADVQGENHYSIWDITLEEYNQGEYVCLDTDQIVLSAKKTCLFHEKVKCKDGMRQLITYKSPILNHQEEPMGTVGIARNVTDVLNMKEEFEIVLEHLPFALLFYGNNGKILSVNNIFEERFKTSRLDIIGRLYDHWVESIFVDFKGNGPEEQYLLLKKDEKNHNIIKVNKNPVYDVFNHITGYFCIFSDITSELTLHETLVRRANTDYLTGLYNRRCLYETKDEIRRNDSLCLLYIDLDDFKIINDRFGHQEGDQVLVVIARSLLKLFPDQKVFRLGGDEFLVLMTRDKDISEIQCLALEFLKHIENLRIAYGEGIKLSASIGIAVEGEVPVDFEELLKRGDAALYKAKQNGKNQYCVWEHDMFQ